MTLRNRQSMAIDEWIDSSGRDQRDEAPEDLFTVFRGDDDIETTITTAASDNSGEPAHNSTRKAGAAIERFTFADLRRQYPNLHPPVVDGLIRAGEVANLISVSKVGKSWLAYNLALSIIDGREWLETFRCERGRVLLIDNELHRTTLAHRIPTVAEAMSLPASRYERSLDVWPLRGQLRSLIEVALELETIPQGTYRAIIFDAKYRFATGDENANAEETRLYNTLDAIAEQSGAALVVVHHSSKGSQSDKRVTDVGSGAGAQSRAADCHLVLREHEESDCVVLDAAVRSFAPVAPLPLRWSFPRWLPDGLIDPTALKGRKSAGDERQASRDKDGCEAIVKALRDGPLTRRALRTKLGMGPDRINRLIASLRGSGNVSEMTVEGVEYIQAGEVV